MNDEKEFTNRLFESIEFLDLETINNLDFYEAALYLETLNKIEESYNALKEVSNG